MTIRAVIFDFGNVVGFFDHHRTTARLVPHSRLSPEALHVRLFGSALENDYDCGRLTTPEFLRRARAEGELECSEDFIATAWQDIFWPNADVTALLPLLRTRYRLLLASNTNELHARQFRKQFAQPLQNFHDLVLSYEIGVRKPNAAFFEHCRLQAGCAPAECLFIDDLLANVDGARQCGWHGAVYSGIAGLRNQLERHGVPF